MPSLGFVFRNIHTHAAAAVSFRFGNNLANYPGPPRIRSSITGPDYYNLSGDGGLCAYFCVSLKHLS